MTCTNSILRKISEQISIEIGRSSKVIGQVVSEIRFTKRRNIIYAQLTNMLAS